MFNRHLRDHALLVTGAAMSAVLVGLAFAVTAGPSAAGGAPENQSIEAPPADSALLFQYLQSGAYQGLSAKETDRHPSAGPHLNFGLPVRVYLNAALDASLAAGNDEHPEGAAAIKEMFGEDGALQGWAVAIKTAAQSDGGNGWYWYEVTSTTDPSRPVAAGTGVTLCSGCHAAGRDYVLSEHPLK